MNNFKNILLASLALVSSAALTFTTYAQDGTTEPASTEKTVSVTDDAGIKHVLTIPAQRVVSLMPHATELLFEVGAGDLIVGAVQYSDYPEAAKAIPRVGGYSALNIEAIVAARPDVIIAWPEGNRGRELEKLKALNLPLFISEPKDFPDIIRALGQLGALTGHDADAKAAIEKFEGKYQQLKSQFSEKEPVSVFYQVWNAPLMSQNGDTFISRAIELCGGRNIFGALPMTNPQVSIEAILVENPDVIVASGMGKARPEWLDDWRQYKTLEAVKRGHLVHIPPALFQRPTSRFLAGTEQLCHAIDRAR